MTWGWLKPVGKWLAPIAGEALRDWWKRRSEKPKPVERPREPRDDEDDGA